MALGTVKFEVSTQSAASPEDILEVMRSWKDLPKYWHGMREIRESGGGMFDVRFAFPGEGRMSYICDKDSFCCTENYHSGPFTGFKRVEISGTQDGTDITVRWDVHLSFKLVLLKGFIVKHFRQGTENALARIVREAEATVSAKARY